MLHNKSLPQNNVMLLIKIVTYKDFKKREEENILDEILPHSGLLDGLTKKMTRNIQRYTLEKPDV